MRTNPPGKMILRLSSLGFNFFFSIYFFNRVSPFFLRCTYQPQSFIHLFMCHPPFSLFIFSFHSTCICTIIKTPMTCSTTSSPWYFKICRYIFKLDVYNIYNMYMLMGLNMTLANGCTMKPIKFLKVNDMMVKDEEKNDDDYGK